MLCLMLSQIFPGLWVRFSRKTAAGQQPPSERLTYQVTPQVWPTALTFSHYPETQNRARKCNLHKPQGEANSRHHSMLGISTWDLDQPPASAADPGGDSQSPLAKESVTKHFLVFVTREKNGVPALS